MSLLLAREFTAQGHEVKIVTTTPSGQSKDDLECTVLRSPGMRQLAAAARWCDILFHNNISLQTAWPLLRHRRPLWSVWHMKKALRARLKT